MTNKEIIFAVSLDELRRAEVPVLNRVNAIVGFISIDKNHVVLIATETFSVKFRFNRDEDAISLDMEFGKEEMRFHAIFRNHRTNSFSDLEDFLFFIRNADIEGLVASQFDAWHIRHAWSKV